MKYILLLLFVIACSSQPKLYSGGSYGEKKLDDDSYLVTYYGDDFHKDQDVQNLLYLRCSEIALKEGYPYFVVLNGHWKREEKSMNHLKVSQKMTLTNTILLTLKPIPGKQNFDAKAIYTKRLKEMELEASN